MPQASLDRRQVLAAAVAGGLYGLLPLRLRTARAEAPAARTLVLLHLRGGNDGLNTVIPYDQPRYRRLRPSLAIPRNQVRVLAEGLGLHPALAGFERLWARERLGVVQGVGYPDPDLSHFRATEIWHTARPDLGPTQGWLGRAFEAAPTDAVLRGVALERELPLSLHGGAGVAAFTDFRRFDVAGATALASLYEGAAEGDGALAEVGRTGRRALETAERLRALSPAEGAYRGRLGRDLRLVAALLAADLGLQVIHLSFNGFDTHAGQADSHRALLQELGDNLDLLQRHIERLGLGRRVVTAVFSEFGRRPEENVSGGTDHGTAGPVFLMGEAIAAGAQGTAPVLDDLVDENLRHSVDFRRIYAGLLRDGLGIDPAPVLGPHAPLELFA